MRKFPARLRTHVAELIVTLHYVRNGRLKSKTEPSGYWETYDYSVYGYEGTGYLSKQKMPFQDSAFDAPDNQCRVITTNIAESSYGMTKTVIEKVLGQEVSRKYIDMGGPSYGAFLPEYTYQCQTAGAAQNDARNLVTMTETNSAGDTFPLKLKRVLHPDGTLDTFSYAISNGQMITTASSGAPNAARTAVVDGTMTVTTTDVSGNRLSETATDIASGLTISTATASEPDGYGRPQKVTFQDGTFEWTAYDCCSILSKIDRFGTTTTYMPDALERTGTEDVAGLSTIYTYDAKDHITKVARQGTDNSQIVTAQSKYDLAGRLYESKDAIGRTTSYGESTDSAGHRVKTTTYPDSSTRTETYYLDGSLLSLERVMHF